MLPRTTSPLYVSKTVNCLIYIPFVEETNFFFISRVSSFFLAIFRSNNRDHSKWLFFLVVIDRRNFIVRSYRTYIPLRYYETIAIDGKNEKKKRDKRIKPVKRYNYEMNNCASRRDGKIRMNGGSRLVAWNLFTCCAINERDNACTGDLVPFRGCNVVNLDRTSTDRGRRSQGSIGCRVSTHVETLKSFSPIRPLKRTRNSWTVLRLLWS